MQKGKFSAAAALFVSTLKNVDFPTFGSPTMPHFSEVPNRPIRGVGFSSSFFLGGISSRSETEKYRKNNLLSTVTTVGALLD